MKLDLFLAVFKTVRNYLIVCAMIFFAANLFSVYSIEMLKPLFIILFIPTLFIMGMSIISVLSTEYVKR